ncbi:MAG TPA: cell division protein FtsK, partial [Alphaproteobacteria bacterium]|nr:cell division protein FtsK [Alphaproteobacteria bacterium]
LNVATSSQAANPLGIPGAVAADLALQALGWAAGGPILALLVWGSILIVRGPRQRSAAMMTLRTLAALIGMTGFAAAVSALPIPQAWPFAAGLGGAFGDFILFAISAPLADLGIPFAEGMVAGLALIVAIGGVFFTFGLRPRDLTAAADTATY